LEFRRVLFRSDGRRYFYFWHYERDNGRFAEEGGLRRPGGLRQGAVGPPPSNGRLPSEGGAGVRPASGADRGPRWRAYLHLEVRSDLILGVARTPYFQGGTRYFRPPLPNAA